MKHEFKIVLEYNDSEDNLLHTGIRVYIDDEIIGCIQDLKLSVNTEDFVPKIEITFPDLSNINSIFKKDIAYRTNNLKAIPIIDVKMKPLSSNLLSEVGTDGYIDSFPIC